MSRSSWDSAGWPSSTTPAIWVACPWVPLIWLAPAGQELVTPPPVPPVPPPEVPPDVPPTTGQLVPQEGVVVPSRSVARLVTLGEPQPLTKSQPGVAG